MNSARLRFFASALPLLLLSGSAFAQYDNGNDAAANAAGCAACGGLVIIPIVIAVTIVALNIALLVWVARDAKARGMDSAVLWMLLVFFTSFIGLIIYLFARPQGNLIQCPNCGNKRLQASVKCPHCGIGS